MTPPLVSILIPSFNSATWLAATLESALAQTWPNTEIILVDDGATDDSVAVARRFEPRGVRVITQPNAGASAARNHALRLAHGDFIQFLDADDLLAPDKIEHQMRTLAVAPRDSVAAGPWGRFERDPTNAVFSPEENWRDTAPVEWLALNFAGRGMMPPAAWLVPRTLTDAVGPWDERLTLNDDGEYFCRVLLASPAVRFCADARTFYRSNLASSLSRRRTEAAWRSAHLSHELCARHLFAHEDSARTHRACADLFQRLAFAMFPDCPRLVHDCEAQVRAHGGSSLHAEGGRLFQITSRCLGWKSVRRLQRAFNLRPAATPP